MSFDTKISILIKKDFIDFLMRIILDNKCKSNINFLLCDKTYLFMHDVKIIEPKQFPDLEIFHIDNFQICTSIAVEVQL